MIGLCNSLQQHGDIDGKFPLTAHWHINDTDSVSAHSKWKEPLLAKYCANSLQRIHLLTNLPEDKIEHLAHPSVMPQHRDERLTKKAQLSFFFFFFFASI